MSYEHCLSYIRGDVYAYWWKISSLISWKAPDTGALEEVPCLKNMRDWGSNKYCTFTYLLRTHLLDEP